MEKGAGLTEVLISLFISSLIITSLMQMYLSHKRQYLHFQKDLEQAFDISRIGDLMRQSVMKAGFTPCLGLSQLSVKDQRRPPRTLYDLKIQTKPYSALLTSRMSGNFSPVIKASGARQLLLSKDFHLKNKRPIVIADCYHAEVHSIDYSQRNAEGLLIHLSKPLFFNYPGRAYVGEWIEEKWFIGSNKQGTKALYVQSNQAEELSSLVSSMRVHSPSQGLIEIQLGLKEKGDHQIIASMRNR